MAKRDQGQAGYCLMDNRIFLARAALHMWEEPCISGKRGSGTVFFSGCNLRCVYCQNYEIAYGKKGKEVSVNRLAEIFLELQNMGAANINFVTPDHYILQAAQAVLLARKQGLKLPIVYNGSGYEKKEVIKNLSGIIDIFLTDFKYMDAALSAKYSNAPDYPERAKEALKEMVNVVGEPVFDKEGMMKKGVIVRHLLLPGHKKNAKDVMHYVDLGFRQISIEPVVGGDTDPYAIQESDLPRTFEEYDILADQIIEYERKGKGFQFFHFMIDLEGGPCVAKRLSGCGSGTEYLAVTPWGDLYPCHQFVGDEQFRMGNVTDGITRPEIAGEFRSCSVYSKEKCRTCFARFYCSGGCMANAYHFHGTIHDTYDIGCEMQRKRVECAIMIKAALAE